MFNRQSIRLYGCFLGLALATYGGFEIWLTTTSNRALKTRICATWLCPPEFSTERVYDVQRDSAAGLSDQSLEQFKQDLLHDPASPYRWADLGEVLFNAHQIEKAKYCFEQAIVRGPNSPSIRFRGANFYFSSGNFAQAMRHLSKILQNPSLPEYQMPVFLTYTRMGVPISKVLALGIPPTRFAAQAFLRFLMEGNQVADAETTWHWISEKALVDDKLSGEYISFLIRNKQEQVAADTWTELTKSVAADYRQKDWAFNGGFEAAPRPASFDWQIESSDDVQATRVQGVAHEGRWSLELDFGGKTNVDYHQAFEETVLSPGSWRLQAFVKTDSITTDQGVALRVYDPKQPQKLDVRTDSLTGSHDWTDLARTFQVGSGTGLVRVEVMRQASQKFDNKVAGKAWIDSVELIPVR